MIRIYQAKYPGWRWVGGSQASPWGFCLGKWYVGWVRKGY